MTSKTTTIITSVIVSIMILSVISLNQEGFAQDERSCDDKITDSVAEQMAKFDETEIQAKTSLDDSFTQKYSNENLREVGIAYFGKTDKENCTATLTNVSNQFLVEKEGELKRVAVSLDAKTLKINEITEIVDRTVEASSQGVNYGRYGGWTVRDDAGESSSNIDEIKAYWSVPTISDPTDINCGTSGTSRCNFTVWAGQTDKYDGSDMIAQAFTNSQCVGNNCGTATYYDGYLQFWDNGSTEVDILCDIDQSVNFDATDDVYAKVKYYAITDQYTLYLENETDNDYCSVAHTETWELPRYGQFQAERPKNGGTPTNLGKVSDFYMEGYFWDNGSQKGLDDLDGGGYDYWEMKIGTGSSDIWVEPGTPTSQDKYLIDYQSSS